MRHASTNMIHGIGCICMVGLFMCMVLVSDAMDLTGNDERTEINIIGLFPISGTSWDGGVVGRAAAELALEEVNMREDLLTNYKIVMHVNDTKCKVGKGIDALYWQLNHPPTKIITLGAACSIICEPMAKAMQYWNMITVSWACSSPPLSNKALYPRFLRTLPSDMLMNGGRIAMMKNFKWRKVAAISETFALFSMVTSDLVKRIVENDMIMITSELFTDDPAQQIQNIKKHDARIIVLGCYENMAVRVFCEAYKYGLYGAKYVWIYPGWYSPKWWEKHESDCTVEELLKVTNGTFHTISIFGNLVEEIGIGGKTRMETESLLKPMIGNSTTYPEWHCAYDGIWAIAVALNDSIDRFREIGKNIEDFTYQDKVMADILQAALYNLSFTGVRGRVIFDQNGDAPSPIGITQIQSGKDVLVGIYYPWDDTMEWVSDIQWLGGFVPKDSTTYRVELVFVSRPIYITMCCFASLGIIVALVLLVFNIAYRKYRLIKMSSPVMNNIILVGCIVTYMTVFFQELSETQAGTLCKTRTLTVMMGFSLSVGALFAKTWRVYVIFTNKTRKIVLKDYQLLLIVLVVICIDVIIFVTREMIAPLTIKREIAETLSYDNGDLIVQKEILVCNSEYDLYFQGVIYGYKGLILIFGAFLAWQTRKVNIPALNDSQYIGMCIYNVAVLSILSAIVVFALDKELELQYLLTSGFLIFGTTVVQLIIFIPKVLNLHNAKNQVDDNDTMTGTTMGTTMTTVENDQMKSLKAKNEELTQELEKLKADMAKTAK